MMFDVEFPGRPADDGLHPLAGRQVAACLFGQVEEHFCQPGERRFARLGDRVQPRIGRCRGLELFYLGHAQRSGAALWTHRLGEQLSVLEEGLRLAGFGAVGLETQGASEHFGGLFVLPGALQQAGNSQVFSGGLGGMSDAFVDHGQVGAGRYVFGVQLGHTDPVLEGLFRFLVLDIEFRRLQESLDGFFYVAKPLGELPHLLERDRVFGRRLGSFAIHLERFIVTLQLEQRQPEAAERFGMIGDLFKSFLVGLGGLVPLLVPGCRMAHAHGFLKNVFASGHSFLFVR